MIRYNVPHGIIPDLHPVTNDKYITRILAPIIHNMCKCLESRNNNDEENEVDEDLDITNDTFEIL